MLYKDLFFYFIFLNSSPQYNFPLVFFDVLAEPEEFVSSVKHHLLLFPGAGGRDVRPGSRPFPPGVSRQQHGGGGSGLHNNNPLPTSLTHTRSTQQSRYSSAASCDRGSPHRPPCAIKSPFIYTRQGGSWIRNRGRGLAGLYWELNWACCGSEALILYQRVAGWVGGRGAMKPSAWWVSNSVCSATKSKATKLPPERNKRKNKGCGGVGGGAAKGSD